MLSIAGYDDTIGHFLSEKNCINVLLW